MRNKSLIALALLGVLAGCNQEGKTVSDKQADQVMLDQPVYCQADIESLFTPPECSPGQKIAFLPRSFGNEQLPILFAARNCDLRYSVAMTRGGVVCIYLPSERRSEQLDDASTDKKPAEGGR